MSDAFWSSLPFTIPALFAVWVGLKNQKITKQIEVQGNSRWTEQSARLDAALTEITQLRHTIAQLLPNARAEGIARAEKDLKEN